jgi:NAD+ kinase
MPDNRGADQPHEARTVGIVAQVLSQPAIELGRSLLARLEGGGYKTWLKLTSELDRELDHEGSLLAGTDLVLVLGGDGTILSVARASAPARVPLVGINFGRVGFLTEMSPSEVDEKLHHYLHGECWVDERAMLHAFVEVDGQQQSMLALNDVVLARGAEPRVIRVKVSVDGHEYGTMVADGVIVSTATGSTAYNLAAGGPILHPQVRSAVLTPIAPHLISDRSLVLDPEAAIVLDVEPGSGGAVLSADGQITYHVAEGTQVRVSANEHVTRFLRRHPASHFYRVLSAKLRGEW